MYTVYMNTLFKAIQSRTVWTIALMFIIGGVQAVEGILPADAFIALNGALSILAAYFRLNPKV